MKKTLLFLSLLVISASGLCDIREELQSDRYEIYYADIESQEFGLDGYADIYLVAKDDFIPIGSSILFMLPLASGYQNQLFCGGQGGEFVKCEIGENAQIPEIETSIIDLKVADFDSDGDKDIFLHSLDSSINSLYLDNDNGYLHLQDQIASVGGYWVSGNSEVEIEDSTGSIYLNSDYYIELRNNVFTGIKTDKLIPTVTGASAGNLNISSGELHYNIPINVVSGPSKVNPSFSINYSSGSALGHLGMGFSVGGTSSVERCASSLLQDGVKRTTSGTKQDRICLDGKRLVLASGNHLENGGEYRLVSDDKTKIIYSDDVFKVYKSNGDIYFYGGNEESRFSGGHKVEWAISRWALSRVENRLGFGYSISYLPDTAGTFIESIDYGNGFSGQMVDFKYEELPTAENIYLEGKKYGKRKILKRIENISGEEIAKEWKFEYRESSFTGHKLLSKFQECGRNSACFEPTVIDWIEGSGYQFDGFSKASFSGTKFFPRVSVEQSNWIDLNRDGNDDFCTQYSSNIECFITTEGEISTDPDISISINNHYVELLWFDINKDGYPDFCKSKAQDYKSNYNAIEIKCLKNDLGQGFSQEWAASINYPVIYENVSSEKITDFNADGVLDVCVGYSTYSLGEWNDWNKCYAGGLDEESNLVFKALGSSSVEFFGGFIDFNGDGLPEMCSFGDKKAQCYANVEGQKLGELSWNISGLGELGSSDVPDYQEYVSDVFDVNGDGFNDYCRAYLSSDDSVKKYQAKCLYSDGKDWIGDFSSPELETSDEKAEAISFFDINRDGFKDWCIEDTGVLTCQINSGGRFSETTVEFAVSHGESGTKNYWWPDLDADGLPELCIGGTGLNGPDISDLYSFISCANDALMVPPDYVEEITNGLGNSYKVGYASAANEDAFGFGVYPQSFGAVPRSTTTGEIENTNKDSLLFINSSMWVVSHLFTSNGVGGQSQQSYKYDNYGYFPNELGAVGFQCITVTSEDGNNKVETCYNQDAYEHTAGRVSTIEESYKINGAFKLISRVKNEWETVVKSPYGLPVDESVKTIFDSSPYGYSYSVRLKETKEWKWDKDGTLLKEVSTNKKYNEDGWLEEVVTSSENATQSFLDKINTYYYPDNEDDWIIGRQKSSTSTSQVTYEGVAQPEVVRESSWSYYDYGPFEGMLKTETIEPNKANYSKTKSYTYNSFGLKESETVSVPGKAPLRKYVYYDSEGRYPEEIVNPLGQSTYFTYDPVDGNKLSEKDPNDLVIQWGYDDVGRVTSVISPSNLSQKTEYKTCDDSCPALAVWYSKSWGEDRSGAMLGAATKIYKDLFGRTIEKRTKGFDGATILTSTVYDSDGKIKKVSEPYKQGALPKWNKVLQRDEFGRVVNKISAAGVTQTVTHEGLSKTINESWSDPLTGSIRTRQSTQVVDIRGNTRSVSDSGGRNVTHVYNSVNDKIKTILLNDVELQTSYDAIGRKVYSSDPNIGEWQYAYDGLDNLILQQNGSGKRVCFEYDSLGRMVKRVDDYAPDISWQTAALNAENDCDGAYGDVTEWVYDTEKGVGRLDSIVMSNGYKKEFFYGLYGELEQTDVWFDGLHVRSGRELDPVTRQLHKSVLPHEVGGHKEEIVYRYNQYDKLAEIGKASDPSHYYWRINTKNEEGKIKSRSVSNGFISQLFDYDDRTGALSQARTKVSLLAEWGIQHDEYLHDSIGNMRLRKDHNHNAEEVFDYDELGRLRLGTITDSDNPELNYQQSVQYNDYGNIESRSGVGTYSYDQSCTVSGEQFTPGPYAVTTVTGQATKNYCYDSGGNMVKSDTTTIHYSSYNKPLSIMGGSQSIAFSYGPSREMLKKEVVGSTGYTKYSIGGYEKVIKSTEQSVKERFSFPGGVIVTVENGDAATRVENYAFNDALGSVTAITDALGQIKERYAYDPWGRPRVPGWQTMEDTSWNNLERDLAVTGKGFTGHEMLDGVGIIHMGGRIYDPGIGRFLSADPIVKGLGNVESYNRYSYVLNNPMSLTDPSGYSWWSENVTDKLRDVRDKYKREILGLMTFGYSEQIRYAGRELNRFAAKNKFAGEIIGVIGTAGCAFLTRGVGGGACMAAFQGTTTTSMTYAGTGSLSQALRAGATSAALSYANANVAGNIGAASQNVFQSAVAHSFRGAFFAGIQGGDALSGAVGGFAGGLTDDWVQSKFESNPAGGTIFAGLIGGTVSSITGGKFAVGAATAAFGYLTNELSSADPHGEPFVENKDLPNSSRDILAAEGAIRELDKDGRLIFSLPQDWEAHPLPRGGGYVIAPPGWVKPDGLHNVVRVQPAGTGSWSFNPDGYYVVYNRVGQSISPYSGRPVGKAKAHNAFTIVIPGRYGDRYE